MTPFVSNTLEKTDMQKTNILTIAACALICLSGPGASQAQTPDAEDLQAVSEKILQGRKDNLQALQSYSWNQRTEVVKDGEVMSTKLELVRYDSNGNEQRSTLSEQKPKQKKRIAGRIQKKKMGEMQEWGESVKSFLMQYTLPDLASLNNFLGKASLGPSQVPGQMELNALNVIQSGDRMTMYVSQEDKKVRNIEVFTNHDGDSVYLETNHGHLDAGIGYTREMRLTITAKGLELKVENFNYNSD